MNTTNEEEFPRGNNKQEADSFHSCSSIAARELKQEFCAVSVVREDQVVQQEGEAT